MLFCRAKSRVDFACDVRDLHDMELKNGAFLFAFFFSFCLIGIECVQWYVNDRVFIFVAEL